MRSLPVGEFSTIIPITSATGSNTGNGLMGGNETHLYRSSIEKGDTIGARAMDVQFPTDSPTASPSSFPTTAIAVAASVVPPPLHPGSNSSSISAPSPLITSSSSGSLAALMSPTTHAMVDALTSVRTIPIIKAAQHRPHQQQQAQQQQSHQYETHSAIISPTR